MLEALALQAERLQHVDEADRAFESDGMERDQGLFARCGFDVLEDLFFVVDQEVTFLMSGRGHGRHVVLLAKSGTRIDSIIRSLGLSERP